MLGTHAKSPGFPGLLFDDRDRPAAYSAVFQQVIGIALRPKVLLERFS